MKATITIKDGKKYVTTDYGSTARVVYDPEDHDLDPIDDHLEMYVVAYGAQGGDPEFERFLDFDAADARYESIDVSAEWGDPEYAELWRICVRASDLSGYVLADDGCGVGGVEFVPARPEKVTCTDPVGACFGAQDVLAEKTADEQ